MGNQNIPTAFFNTTEVVLRSTETPFADFFGGVNPGGSCSMGIGIATGNINPKEQDWSRQTEVPRAYQVSSYIGFGESILTFYRGALDTNDNAGFGVANIGDSAPLTIFDSSLVLTNETGETILQDEFVWAPNVQGLSPADGVILTDGIAIGSVPATFYNPINMTITGEFVDGDVEVDLAGVTDDGAYALVSFVLAGPTLPEAAQQLADAISALDGVTATAFQQRVIIQPVNTENTPNNKFGDITLTNYTITPSPP